MIALSGITIQSKIYESSNSLVYRGIRTQDERAIVVKMLKQDYPSPQELTRYRQEYEITRSLNLEGVVKAYRQQDYQRTLVILLEDFGGESLEQWMQQQSGFCPMSLPAFLRLAIALTDILGSIHAKTIIHKDINPGNIVFNPDTGVVKMIDFGIATRFNRTNPTFKSHYSLEGTLAYLSPEQTGRMNRSLDYRTDFYSLGITFYELLTGHLPFPTTNLLELIHCHIAKQPVPPHEMNATIPKPVSDIILKLMAKNAEDRYQSAWGIKADLEICVHQLEQSGQIDRIELGLQDVSAQFQIPQKLYGREAEIAALLAAFDRVAGREDTERGRHGEGESNNIPASPCPPVPLSSSAPASSEMLLVSGYAGIGKSALVQELYKPITQKRGYFISGKFDQLQRNIPYGAITDALQKLVQQLLGEPDEQLQQWRSRLLTALGSNGQIIIDVIPEVELIIGKQPPVPEVGATEAQNRFNRVFQQFIRVFCSQEHPLVIFLDDLQWADSATLKLIELMMLDEQTQSLFLIGAYRDNEVNPAHPLALTLERLRKQRAVLQEIILAPLTLEPLSQLIAETLHQNTDTVRSLAELVLHKTEGNPFFVGEFLRMLHSENLLTFDAALSSWQWNTAQIQVQNTTDNVVELLLLKLLKLPEGTQQMLRLAACVGAEFDLETLAIVCEKSPKAIFQDLLAAIQAGLVQPLSDLDEDLLVQEHKFPHDRVQQAAYALINEEHKKAVHFQIGRLLLTNLDSKQLSKRLFEVVDHLNNGRELIAKPSARIELVKLNLEAGKKAKAATAHLAALQYLMVSTELTTEQIWDSDYELAFELYTERACVEYLNGHFDRSEKLINLAVKRVKTASEKAEIYNILIIQYTLSAKYAEAIQTGRHALSLIDIHLPETDFETARDREMAAVDRHLAGRAISSLFELPYMSDPEKKVAIKLLTTMGPPTYRSHPKLWSVICSKAVNLCLQYGNVSQAAYSYTSYGGLLSYVLNEYQAGEEFGKLALKLSHKFNNPSDLSVAYLMIGSSLKHWSKHLKYATEDYQQAYNAGWESGNLQYAAYAFGHNVYCRFYQGINLKQLLTEISDYMSFSRSSKNQWAIDLLIGSQILIGNLIGITNSWSDFCHEEIPEKQYLERFLVNKNFQVLCIYHVLKMQVLYLYDRATEALKCAKVAQKQMIFIATQGLLPSAAYNFYSSAILASLYLDANPIKQQEYWQTLSANQEQMKIWADNCPENFLHQYLLVAAEMARIVGKDLEAMDLYDRAIESAQESGFIHYEAMANELAAKFWLAKGKKQFAQIYLNNAYYNYRLWGAKRKLEILEAKYPQLLPTSIATHPRSKRSVNTIAATCTSSAEALDLATVMKAAQAISSEIELERLLSSLMQILIENAGAQTGCLLLKNSGEWTIEAACELNDGGNICATQVLQSLPTANRLPESVIQYVIRTHESIILNDATREGNLINEAYIQQNQTRSLLCMPLLNQSNLVGVLYLENQLAAGAFTPERSQVLQLLSTQAAIAIENANLYSELRAKESKITQFLEAIPVGIAIVDATGRPYYTNQCGNQLTGKETDTSIAPEQISEAYQLYVAGTDQIYPAESLPIVRALRGERIRTEDIEIRRDHVTILIEARGTPVFDQQGNITYAIATFQDITERKQAEKLLADYNCTLEQQVAERTAALRQSEVNYRNLLQTANSVIVRYDPQGRIRYINDYGVKLLGYEEHEILGRTLFETIIPEAELSGRDVRPMVRDLLRNPQSYPQGEGENLCRDGRRVWMVWSNQAIFNDQGEVVEILSVGNDTTQRRQAEEALQRSEAKFRTIFENSQVGIYRTRLCDGLILEANQRFADLFGFDSPEEMIGLEHTTGYYVNPNVRQQAIEMMKRDGEVRSFEVQIRKRDGTLLWGLFSSRLNVADECVEGVVADISKQQTALHERKQAEEALQASETKLRTLIKAIPDPLFVLSAEGRFLEIMVLEPNLLWQPFEEMIGQTMHQLGKEQADEFVGYIQQVLRTQQTLTVEYSAFLNGREAWFSARIAPIDHGQVIWLARDITLQKQAEAASILEERNRMAREIHDTLAQAFTGILAQVGAAKQVLTDDVEATQAHLDLIKELARTGLTEARRSVVALRPQLLEEGSLRSALHRLVAQLRTAAMDTTLYYEIEGAAYSLPTEVESNLLRIGQEALTNAIRHANADEIRVELVYDRDQVCLRVKDNGQGFGIGSIPASEGFGLLGMSERAERIGAQLTIRSQPRQGTEIIVTVNRE